MNPLTNVRNLTKMNERELELNVPENASWHQMYKDSSWIFFGGVDPDLTEGDLICVFSQWGEIVNIHLVRDRTTGRSKGFGFLAFYDQRSTILAVDNANGIKLCGRIIRVDHCENYKIPKNLDKLDLETRELIEKGCAPKPICVRKSNDVDKNSRKFEKEDNIKKDGKKKNKTSDVSNRLDDNEKDYKKQKNYKDDMKKDVQKEELRKDSKRKDDPRIDQTRRRDENYKRRNDDEKRREDGYRDKRGEEFKKNDSHKYREDDDKRRKESYKK